MGWEGKEENRGKPSGTFWLSGNQKGLGRRKQNNVKEVHSKGTQVCSTGRTLRGERLWDLGGQEDPCLGDRDT